jgi:hypothetical protein
MEAQDFDSGGNRAAQRPAQFKLDNPDVASGTGLQRWPTHTGNTQQKGFDIGHR